MLTTVVTSWDRLMARQQLLLTLSSVGAMLLFTLATTPTAILRVPSSGRPLNWLVTVVVYAVLAAFVRRFPLAVVAVATAGSVVLLVDAAAYPPTLPALLYAVYRVALDSPPGRTLAVGVTVKATLLAGSLVTHPGITGFVVLLAVALAVTTGSAARSHRAWVEDEANRRVTEERLRIARELHDAVGHHVALISVQAGALGYLLDDEDLSQARESVSHIQRAGEEALGELRLTVGLLRAPGAPDPAEPPEPLPRLDRLGELIGAFAGAGLRVTCEVSGQDRPLPEAVELTAYRVIQESLTNTRKHAGCDTAVVRIGYAPDTLELAVEDRGVTAVQENPHPGHGIVGMRERVAAMGGRLTVGPRSDGGYHVLAELPLHTAGVTGP